MATQHFGLLEEREENELHKSRLLNVEEKPFKRITKRLISPGALTNPSALKLPTPPPEGSNSKSNSGDGEAQDDAETVPHPSEAEIAAFKEDIILDFAAFDSAIARLQFLAQANAEERERYATDRLRILDTMESVRESNAQLRLRLDQAKATLAQRKRFDDLADKITSNRMLRTRAEQHVNLEKLAEECEELQRESETYSDTWRERKEQFDRLVEEGKRLRALIRDEKEEVERREGMDSDADDGEAVEGNGATPGKAGSISGGATPRHDSGAGMTPRPASRGERTPRPDSPGASNRESGSEGLRPRGEGSAATPAGDSQSGHADTDQPEEGEDVEMGESTQNRTQIQHDGEATPMGYESQETPQITINAPAGGEDKMDTT